MEPHIFNKSVNYLLLYLVILVLLIGMFGNDVVNDMVRFTYLYGIPLFTFIILYLVTFIIEIYNNFTRKLIKKRLLAIITMKLCIGITPMFYLDNSFASLLSALRLQ